MKIPIQKAGVFILTFMGYAALHALREGWSYSKDDTRNEFHLQKTYMGIVDALYLAFYSIGMGVLGSLMHKVTLKFYVIGGIIISSVFYMLWIIIYSLTGFYNVALMTIFMCINGFFQATGWPGLVGIFNNWFAQNKKGLLMGIWCINSNIGNIIAEALLNVLSDNKVNFVWNYILTGGLGLAVGLLMIVFMKESPKKQQDQELQKSIIQDSPIRQNQQNVTQSTDKMDQKVQKQSGRQQQNAEEPKVFKYGIFSALTLPRVPNYVISYSCLKGCVYGLLFWLPTILSERSETIKQQKGYICSMFDIGAVIGGIALGGLADFFNKRALFLSPSLLLSSVVMFVICLVLQQEPWPYYLTIFLVGMFISGPYNLIGTLIAIDIGNNIKQKSSVAKVSSLIQGFAALFTSIEMIVISYIDTQIVFYLFAGETLVATILLLPLFLQQLKQSRQAKNQIQKLNESD